MNRRIDNAGPSGGHSPAAGANARLNAAAAFRALLLGLMRPQAGALTDKRGRRGSATAGVAQGRGGSHAGAETDEAVEASASNQGGNGSNGRQRRDRERGGATSDGAIPTSSLLFSALAAADAARASPAPEPISSASPPLLWPSAALPNAWQRVDAASPYVPSPAFAGITAAPAPAPKYTPWNPVAGGNAALPAARRWRRAESVSSYVGPVTLATPRVDAKRYRAFTPLRRPVAMAVSNVSQRLRPGGWFRAAAIRPFVLTGAVVKRPIQRARYRRFAPLSSARGSMTPNTFKAGQAPRASAIQPYRPSLTFAGSRTKRFAMRPYMPPSFIPHAIDAITLAPWQQRATGERPLLLSIDSLLRDRSGSALPHSPAGTSR